MSTAVFWFIARIVRQIVTNLLKAIGTDGFGERIGLKLERGLSDLLGMILFIILLVTIIAALDRLNITALSVPTTTLLTTIVDAIPNLIGAALIVIIAYAILRLLMTLVTDLLRGVGFDSLPERLGLGWTDVVAWIMRFYGSVSDFEAAFGKVTSYLKEGQSESGSG